VVNIGSPPVEWLSPLIKNNLLRGSASSVILFTIIKEKKVQLSASLILHGTGRWWMMQDHANKLPSFLP
jgi:hypothetical protein